jgi:uncharacterized protein (DUF362 family)/Pyruvate/2-oxoacid:ferredoxin oxidoreductase delta subunit
MNKKVGIERCASYDPAEVYAAMKRAMECAGTPDLSGKTVLLKPNILSDTAPEKVVTTHPVFLEAAIRLVREMGSKRILVGDSPGMQGPGFSGRISGLVETVRKNNAEWVDFTREKIEVACPDGRVVKKFHLTHTVREADIIISLPKLKTHQLMYFTGAIKNSFGLVPSLDKTPFHARFSSRDSFAAMLVDLNLAVKPAYALMDAVIGMEGPGPGSGTPRQIGLVLASSNILALDAAATEIIGYPVAKIPTNKEALSRKFWLSGFDEIEYPLLAPADVRIPDYIKIQFSKSNSQFIDFLLPRPLKRLRDSRLPGPKINHGACVRCGDCIRICSANAMSLAGEGKERRIIIDYERCIRCYCCHEICPAKAIDVVKKPGN